MPEYGLALWNIPSVMSRHIFRTFDVAFNNAIKKILGAPSYASSHISANICNVLLLEHHLSLVQVRFLKRTLNLNNVIVKLSFPHIKSGYLCNSAYNYFIDKYSVNLWQNDLDILSSRINWVQRHEERSRIVTFMVSKTIVLSC